MDFVEVRGSSVEVAIEAGLAELGIGRDDAAITVIEEPAKGFLGMGGKTALVRISPKPKPKKRRNRGRGKPKSSQGETPGGGRSESGRSDSGDSRRGSGRSDSGRGSGRDSGRDSGRSDSGRGSGRSGSGGRGGGQKGQQRNQQKSGQRKRSDRMETPVDVEEQAQVAQDFLEGLLDSFGLEGKVETRTEEDIIYATVTGEQTEALVGPKASIMDAINELLRTIIQRKTHRRARLRLDIGGYNERRREALKIYAGRLAEQVSEEGGELMLEPMNPAERKVVHDAIAEIDGVRSFSEGEEPNRSVVIAPTDDAPAGRDRDESDDGDAGESGDPDAVDADAGEPETDEADSDQSEDAGDDDGAPMGGLRG